jgi:hypothetical protein
MFSLVLLRSIPFQYRVSYLELLLLGFLIKNLLDPLLMVLNSDHYLLSGLLDLADELFGSYHWALLDNPRRIFLWEWPAEKGR